MNLKQLNKFPEHISKEINSFHNQLAGHNLKWLKGKILFSTLHGSQAYGTSLPTSDVDIKGFCVAPMSYYTGLGNNFEQAELKSPDAVVYDIRKFFKLAAECNPNIIEVLFTEPDCWVNCSPLGQKIIDNRDVFLSKKARHTFAGYAHAQLQRINLHYRWLKNPAKEPPTRSEFGLPEKSLVDPNQLSAALAEIKKKIETWDINWEVLDPSDKIEIQTRLGTMLAESKLTMENLWTVAAKSLGFDDNFILYVQKEKEYKQKQADWNSYQTWKTTRNPKRAELEKKFHFDTKHAGHLVRLLRMCKEILTTGKVLVKRPDAEELLAIRNGAWTYEQVIEWADNQNKELDTLYSSCDILPRSPNLEKISKLCMETIIEQNNENQ